MSGIRLIRLSLFVYRHLLHLYPNDFRHEFGREMQLVFRNQVQDAVCRSSAWEIAQIWVRSLFDIIVNACGERWAMQNRNARNRFLLLASGDVALILSWIWLLWTLAFATLIHLDPWDFSIWVRPVGTFAGSISYFFGRTPGLFVPSVLMLVLQFRRLIVMWRASSSRGRLVWSYALTNVLCAFAILGVISVGWRLTEALFPQFFVAGNDVGYGRTALSILADALLLTALLIVQPRLASPHRVQPLLVS